MKEYSESSEWIYALTQLRIKNIISPESHELLSEEVLQVWGSRLAVVLGFSLNHTSLHDLDDYFISERELEEGGLRDSFFSRLKL